MANGSMNRWLRPFAGAVTVPLLVAIAGATTAAHVAPAQPVLPQTPPIGFTGSKTCRDCHPKFYELWSTSHHGLAMQPFTDALAKEALSPQEGETKIGQFTYRADLTPGAACMRESGPGGEKSLPILHAMGGKNVFYFLTPADRGMLQTLPLAYDVHKKEWFDTSMSAMRHAGGGRQDQQVNWRERAYTFNTSCYSCHVSQLSTNYDAKADSYHTTWAEPGINCETCHGPSAEHARMFREATTGEPPRSLGLISIKSLTKAQRNDTCAPCHAKMQPITASFMPGDRFFDHYGLVTLEDPDFYPDGRDLGENYTYTLWRMNPCAQSGQMDCMHCHTSSGRYRFKDPEKANDACLPCHQDKVDNAEAHTHHKPGTEGGNCIDCHMPKTEFARMVRHDHSMLPPTPAATIKFASPNACNLCHADKDAKWADELMRAWRAREYQAPVLVRAGLVDAARKGDWSRLADMLAYVQRPDRDEVTAASLLRLSAACGSPEKWPAVLKALKDSSPLVRACAAESLDGYVTRDSVKALLAAMRDDYRLVRVRAAAVLAGLAPGDLPAEEGGALKKAMAEYEQSLYSRPDDYASHFNLGNLHAKRNEYAQAVDEYEKSASLNPTVAAPLVNLAMLESQHGHSDKAEDALRRAIKADPKSAPAHFNLGLLFAETGRMEDAQSSLRTTLQVDPRMAQAACNLGVLLMQQGNPEGMDWCRKAWELEPFNAKYGYTYAFYQLRAHDEDGAIKTLSKMQADSAFDADSCLLLGSVYEQRGERDKAREVYSHGAALPGLEERERAAFMMKAQSMQ